jgi:hypothetical protein
MFKFVLVFSMYRALEQADKLKDMHDFLQEESM